MACQFLRLLVLQCALTLRHAQLRAILVWQPAVCLKAAPETALFLEKDSDLP